jgi:hypothetical protein
MTTTPVMPPKVRILERAKADRKVSGAAVAKKRKMRAKVTSVIISG